MSTAVLKKEYNTQQYAYNAEAYSLLYFMATGKPMQSEYLIPENRVIFNAIKNMIRTAWQNISVDSLISYLHDLSTNDLEKAGGENRIRRMFANFDPKRDMEVVK